MPKLKEKVLTATLYTYVKPTNNKWVRSQAKKEGVSYSQYLDHMIDRARWRKKTAAKASKAA